MKTSPKFLSKILLFIVTSGLSPLTQVDASVPKLSGYESISAANIRFVFQTFEGDFKTLCKHELIDESSPYDLKVECYRGTNLFAQYSAHIALKQYPHSSGDTKFSIELMYWLTGTRLPSEVGSTTWIHLAERTAIHGVKTSQTVENGTAGLYLEITPSAFARRAPRLQ